MKRLSIAVILIVSIIGTAQAKNDPSFTGSENFYSRFPKATDVHYKVKGQFTEVNFIWNGLALQAFYDQEGNPIATTRSIAREDLPINIQLSLKNEYADGVITNAIEYTNNDGLSYYVTLARPKMTYLLQVSTSGEISVFKKMRGNALGEI